MKDTVIVDASEQATGVYLAKKNSKVVHFWTGTDTVCRMYSTGGIKSQDFDIVTTTLGRNICTQCGNVAVRLKLDI